MSSARITSVAFVLLLLSAVGIAKAQEAAPAGNAVNGRSAAASGETRATDPAALFQRGQMALSQGRLDEAERDFRGVLQLDPQAGGAYANLGVVYMRRKQWAKALEELHQAQKLLPQVAGIRLNIGLAYYRQNEFLKATPAFESVLRDQPEARQARYLLGLCYFFAERWADAATTLEPLWAQESANLAYLYVLANAAHRAGKKELDNRASAQLIQVGDGSPEYRMFVGKYYLNLEQYDSALAEFQAAADSNPELPFVHFNLGLAYLKKQDYEHACREFLKDIAVEPDLALNYNELGKAYWLMQEDAKAETSFRQALRLDPRLVSSHLGLAKIYEHQHKYAAALQEADTAVKLDPQRSDSHYVRGQALLRMGRKQEANAELQAAARNNDAQRAQGVKQREAVPSPELLQDSQ